MDKLFSVITLTLILILAGTTVAYADSGFFWFSGGNKDGNGNFAVGFGGDNLGIEIGFIDDATRPAGTFDYQCPHWNYTSMGIQTLESTAGIDLLGMLHLSEHFILYGGPGLYWHHSGEVVRSNDTGWYYTETDDTSTKIACSGGVRFLSTEGHGFAIGYHSLRGANLTFQFSF